MATALKRLTGTSNDIIDLPTIPATQQYIIDRAQREFSAGKLGSLRVSKRGVRAVVHHDENKTTIAKANTKFGVREIRNYDITDLPENKVEEYVATQIQQGEQLQDVCEVVKRHPASLRTKKQMLSGKK